MEPDSIQRVGGQALRDDDTPGDRQPLQLLALDPARAAEPQHERNNRRHHGSRAHQVPEAVDDTKDRLGASRKSGRIGNGRNLRQRSRRKHGRHHGKHHRNDAQPHDRPPTARQQRSVRKHEHHQDQTAEGRNPQPVHRPRSPAASGQGAVGGKQRVVGVPRHHRRQLPAQALHQKQPADRIARHAGHDERPDNAETQEGDTEHDAVVQPRNRLGDR